MMLRMNYFCTLLSQESLFGDRPCKMVRDVNISWSEHLLGITYTDRMP